MRFLIMDGDYQEFLSRLYNGTPTVRKLPCDQQMIIRNDSLQGMCDFYSSNLQQLGQEAYNVWVNNEVLQRRWARENGFRSGSSWRWNLRLRRGFVPWIDRIQDKSWMYRILAEQIRRYKPDVLVNMLTGFIAPEFLRDLTPRPRLVMGWGNPGVKECKHNSADLREVYDLILAPSEGMVDYFRGEGLKAELLRHAFEPRILSMLGPSTERTIPVSFIGLLRGGYSERRKWLETLCANTNGSVFVWASSLDLMGPDSPIRKRLQGEAWGRDTYRILSMSKISLNNHHQIAGQSADNVRMYQVTGVGTLLLTDWKDNLHRIFETDREIVTYRTAEECIDLIRYYLEHDAEREAIARAGQQRTLREHTYWHRAQELTAIARKYS
jgi:spore maturation protein CgeB